MRKSGKSDSTAHWARAAIILVVLGLMAVLLFVGYRLVTGLVGLFSYEAKSNADPQFAEPIELVTRPPEDHYEGISHGDLSSQWDLGEQTPVDRTADQLIRDALSSQAP